MTNESQERNSLGSMPPDPEKVESSRQDEESFTPLGERPMSLKGILVFIIILAAGTILFVLAGNGLPRWVDPLGSFVLLTGISIYSYLDHKKHSKPFPRHQYIWYALLTGASVVWALNRRGYASETVSAVAAVVFIMGGLAIYLLFERKEKT